jgi:type II secretory pathway pseudopilin PulG
LNRWTSFLVTHSASDSGDLSASDSGDTLVEVLMALAIIALVATALLGAFASSIAASSERQGLVTIDTVLKSYVESSIYQIQQQPTPLYTSCAATYTPTFSAPSGYLAGISSVKYWSASSNQFVPACPGGSIGPQQVTATVQGPTGIRDSLDFVVSNPINSLPVFHAPFNLTVGSTPQYRNFSISVNVSGGPSPNLTTPPDPHLTSCAALSGDTLPASDFHQTGPGTGTISGTTPASGPDGTTYSINIGAWNVAGSACQTYNLVVNPVPAVTNVCSTSPPCAANAPSTGPVAGGTTVTIVGTGFDNTSTVSFGSVSATSSTLNDDGTITAISPPESSAGLVDVRVTTFYGGTSATNANDKFGYYSAPLSINPASLPDATQKQTNYSATLSATGGVPPYTRWTIVSGSLPGGLHIDNTGKISGNVNANATTGPDNFSAQVTDSAGQTATQSFTINVDAAPTIPTPATSPSPPPLATKGLPYLLQINESGGAGTLAWSISQGVLPSGLTLSSTGSPGAITGTVSASATSKTYNFTVVVTDANLVSASQQLSIVVP